jgi:hypothetical protein
MITNKDTDPVPAGRVRLRPQWRPLGATQSAERHVLPRSGVSFDRIACIVGPADDRGLERVAGLVGFRTYVGGRSEATAARTVFRDSQRPGNHLIGNPPGPRWRPAPPSWAADLAIRGC